MNNNSSESAPYKLLLNNSNRIRGSRPKQELDVMQDLLKNSRIFSQIELPQETLIQLCNLMVLIWAENPHIIETENHQAFFILEGKGFEYMNNQNQIIKSKYFQGNDYIMMRKLQPNDFFIVHSFQDKFSDYSSYKYVIFKCRKYQLMIDQGTLVGKIQGQAYQQLLRPAVEDRYKKVNNLFQRFQMLRGLPQSFFAQASRYMKEFSYEKGEQILNKSEQDPHVKFVSRGQIELRIQKNQVKNKQMSSSRTMPMSSSKEDIIMTFGQFEIIGLDSFNEQKIEQNQSNYSLMALTFCSLYRIQKRTLALIISSFQDVIKKKNNFLSSINLNEQVQGGQPQQKSSLAKNVELIRNSLKKNQNIKLKCFQSGQKKKSNNLLFNEDHRIKDTLIDFKSSSCYSFSNIKIIHDDRRFSQTSRTGFGSLSHRKETYQAKIFSIDVQTETDRAIFNEKKVFPYNSQVLLKKKYSSVPNRDSEQDNILQSYLQNKLKNEMIKKAGLILQRNITQRGIRNHPAKRIFSLKDMRAKSQNQHRPIYNSYRPLSRDQPIRAITNKKDEKPSLAKYISFSKNSLQFNTKKIIDRKIQLQKRQESKNNKGILVINK